MCYTDLLITILSCFQPIIIGFLAIVGIVNQFSTSAFFKKNNSHRQKTTSTRLYECSTNYRLAHFVIFEVNAMGIVLAYLIYDIDFIFFLAETTTIANYSFTNFFLLLYFFFLFLIGLVLDNKIFGIKWKY